MELINKINKIKTKKELQEYKLKINEAFEKREKFIGLCETAEKLSKKDFGFIKEAFENISPMLFKQKGGKTLINNYIQTIKENKNLNNLATLYENIRKTNANADVNFFVENIVNINWNVSKSVKTDTLKVGRILAEGILLLGEKALVMLPEEKNSLNKAIEFISENSKNTKNIAEYSDAIKVIREHIKSNDNKNIFESVNVDDYAFNLINAFNKKYSNLTNEEINLIKKINTSENKEEIFNQYKNECLNKLSNAMKNENDADVEKLSEVYNKVKNKTFVLENIGTDICGFAELTKIFD